MPHPVGTKTANAFGLFDMLGNAAEWTWDAFQQEAFEKDSTDPVIGGLEMKDIYVDRVYRGQGFMMVKDKANVADRSFYGDANIGGDSIGFRPVRTVKK